MVTPPPLNTKAGQAHQSEIKVILNNLYDKALMIKKAFEQMEGVKCYGDIGAMYLFPRLNILPPKMTDFDYCMALLKSTGLVTVNGEGFGQKQGTHHLRIAFLPPKLMLESVLPKWIDFHQSFLNGSK